MQITIAIQPEILTDKSVVFDVLIPLATLHATSQVDAAALAHGIANLIREHATNTCRVIGG